MAEKRKYRGRAVRARWARRWLESGLTTKRFAREHGLAPASLARWARELRTSEAPAAQFVEVAAVSVPRLAVRVIVGPVVLEFEDLPPAEYVAALAGRPC